MDISLEETTNIDAILSVMGDKDIFERAYNIIKPKSFLPDVRGKYAWISCMVNNYVVGMIYVEHHNISCLKIHVNILKPFRIYGREIMIKFYEWVNKLPETVIKVVAAIPECYRSVINFAEKVGFRREGINRQSYIKNNKRYDEFYMGITRHEMGEVLSG